MATQWALEKTVDFYKEYSKVYDSELNPETYPAPFFVPCWVFDALKAERSAVFAAEDPNASPLRVLDLGCGTGQSSKLFFSHRLRNCFQVFGVDASPDMLDFARKLPFHSVVCQDIEQLLPFDCAFDAVICIGVLDFVRKPHDLLTHIHNYLVPGGVVGLTVPLGSTSDKSHDAQQGSTQSLRNIISNHHLFITEKEEEMFGYRDSQSGHITMFACFLLRAIAHKS